MTTIGIFEWANKAPLSQCQVLEKRPHIEVVGMKLGKGLPIFELYSKRIVFPSSTFVAKIYCFNICTGLAKLLTKFVKIMLPIFWLWGTMAYRLD